jgi:TPR repeat protein
MYEYGSPNDPINLKEAFNCYRAAAKKGNTKAMLNLGNMYEKVCFYYFNLHFQGKRY